MQVYEYVHGRNDLNDFKLLTVNIYFTVVWLYLFYVFMQVDACARVIKFYDSGIDIDYLTYHNYNCDVFILGPIRRIQSKIAALKHKLNNVSKKSAF